MSNKDSKSAKYKRIPISAAKEIAKNYDKNLVVIVTWDAAHNLQHVTTYGRSKVECEAAARGGNLVKQALGWPPEECNAVPSRAKAKSRVDPVEQPVYNGDCDCSGCRMRTGQCLNYPG